MKPLVGTANLLAGQAVAHAEAFVGGRGATAGEKIPALVEDLDRLKASQEDLPTRSIIDSARMLLIALRGAETAYATVAGDDRWLELVKWLAARVRDESKALAEQGHVA
jgi:hypothetical protein